MVIVKNHSLKGLVARHWLHHITKTAKIKKMILLSSTSSLYSQCVEKCNIAVLFLLFQLCDVATVSDCGAYKSFQAVKFLR